MRKLALVLLLLSAGFLSAQAATAQVVQVQAGDTPITACNPSQPPVRALASVKGKLFGVVEDSGQTNCADSMYRMGLAGDVGDQAVRILVPWGPGVTYVSDDARFIAIRNNVIAIRAQGLEPILLVAPDWNRRKNLHMPISPSDQRQFMHFVTWLYTNLVDIGLTKVAVFLEPNSEYFWYPQCASGTDGDAPHSVTRLLMMVYDDLHKAAEAKGTEVTVIGPELSSHGQNQPSGDCKSWSPVDFILAMGKAKAEYCRQKPETCGQSLWDWFSIHPYGLTNDEPPNRVHFDGTIGFGDYKKLRQTLCKAFPRDSGQSCWTAVFYSEWEVQTVIPSSKAGLYSGKETVDAVSFPVHVEYTQEAIRFAFCQKGVIGLLMFLTFDEKALRRWQSGVYFVDGTAKPSLPGISQVLEAAAAGTIDCSASR
jgi:hypothetical protein